MTEQLIITQSFLHVPQWIPQCSQIGQELISADKRYSRS
jgi:hypothetical protein